MKMARASKLVLMLLLPAWMTLLCTSASGHGNSYVRDACSVTHYPDVCIHSLAPFSQTAKRNPTTWARAGVSVSVGEAKIVVQYLIKLKRYGSMRGRNQVALLDCIDCFQNTLDNLHKSLGVIRKLNSKAFVTQMDDITTWLSAAMTDEDTCLGGFNGQKEKQVRLLCNKVLNMSYITSNALALVNKLATIGPGSLISTDLP
ncbi:pectinesterase inhibitor 6-like [Camellia sinensis]|nr:pectinesterase inhibitor 6-like [Camellia sinensis]